MKKQKKSFTVMQVNQRLPALCRGQRINLLDDTKAFLKYAAEGWKAGTDYSYSIRTQGARFIGSFGVINENGKLQFGYIFSPTQWGNGYATEVCKAMMAILTKSKGRVQYPNFY